LDIGAYFFDMDIRVNKRENEEMKACTKTAERKKKNGIH
jgi:hypothetical protein